MSASIELPTLSNYRSSSVKSRIFNTPNILSPTVSTCSPPNRKYCLDPSTASFVLQKGLGNEFTEPIKKIKRANLLKDVGSVFSSLKVLAPVSFVLNIVLIIILKFHQQAVTKLENCDKKDKILNNIFWLNTIASMNAAVSLALTILQFNDAKIFNKDLVQIFSIVLTIFNILGLVYAVQLQISNNTETCKTNTWVPLLWIIPSILLIYLIFLIINANTVKNDIEEMF